MNSDYPVEEVPATPDFVFRIFQGWVRQWSEDIDRNYELTMATTIEQFGERLMLLPWPEMVLAIEAGWRMKCDWAEWERVLTPEKERTVGELCEFLAMQTTEPRIRPLRIAGVTCSAAGAFLSVKSMLVADGAPPDEIYPSAPIQPFVRRHSRLFAGPISRLAPGAMPIMDYHFNGFVLLLFVAILGAMVICFGGTWTAIALCGLKLALFIAGSVQSKRVSSTIEMRSISTFRELSLWIAHVNGERVSAVATPA